MNWTEFKDPLCYLCLTDAVVTSFSLSQEVTGSNNLFEIYYFLSLNSANAVKTLRKNPILLTFLETLFF